MPRDVPRSERIYRFLLRLVPFDFQREYGTEMEDCFRQEQKHVNPGRLWFKTVIGFLKVTPSEHLDVLRRDLRHSARSLAKNRLMATIAVSVLAVGIGASTALFSEVNLMVIRPLPVPLPEQVVRVVSQTQTGTVTYEQYLQFRDQGRTLSQLAAFQDQEVTYRVDGPPELTVATRITGNYFHALPVTVLLGRVIAETDDQPGAAGVVMLSEEFWRDRFNADPSVIGRIITVDGASFTVVGVTPDSFGGADRDKSRDLWLPWNALHSADTPTANLIGRLRNAISAKQAQADLSVIATQLSGQRSGQPLTVSVHLARLVPPVISRQVVPLFAFFLALVGLSLAIPCLNIGSLFLARAAERRREMGIRIALGAGRGQLLRQLLTESFLLAIVGCIAGMCVFLATIGVFVSFFQLSSAYASRLVFDWRVAVFALALSLVTTVMSGLAPALHAASTEVISALKDGDSTGTFKRWRLRAAFIVGQVAISALFLAMSGLFVRSLTSSRVTDLGFNATGVITGRISLDSRRYAAQRGSAFYESLLRDLETSTEVTSANIAEMNGPLGAGAAKARALGNTQQGAVYSVYIVSRGHFRTLGIPMIAGRDFSAADAGAGTPKVGIVNQALAQQHWPGEVPIGKSLDGVEIIGLVHDTNYLANTNAPKQFLYLPLVQNYTTNVMLLAKTNGDPSSIIPVIREAVARLDPEVPVANAMSLNSVTNLSLLPVRIVATAAGILGILALGLAAMGIHGTVAFLVRQRTHEIGIRIALGAPPSRLVRLTTREALHWILIGLVLGCGSAVLVARALRGLIFGVSATDPLAYLTVTLLLGSAALIASWFPARRATRIDPVVALRHE